MDLIVSFLDQSGFKTWYRVESKVGCPDMDEDGFESERRAREWDPSM